MIGIDTNILLRWLAVDFIEDDAAGQQALVLDLLERAEEPLFVNVIVVIELVWLLRKRFHLEKPQAVELIRRLLELPDLVVQERGTLLAAVESYSMYPGDFSDHLIGEINRQNECRTTFTFDRAAAKSPNFSELTRLG